MNTKELENETDLPRVKCNDVLSIETKPGYKIYCSQAAVLQTDVQSSTILYTIRVPDKIGNEINIYSSKADMIQYLEKKLENATLKMEFADVLNSYVVQDGDYVRSNQNVTVSIVPHDGYYITGKNVGDDGRYSETMTYADYNKKIDEIIKKHKAEKYIQVKLSPGDSYGHCTYNLDKQEINGTYNFRKGQKITLTYKITDDSYQIDKLFGDKTVQSETITISTELDGAELNREQYIKIKKK